MCTHASESIRHLEEARAGISDLETLTAKPTYSAIERREFQDSIRYDLKIAEVEALLAIASALDRPASGVCWDSLAPIIHGDLPTRCALPAGHLGAHQDDTGCTWSLG